MKLHVCELDLNNEEHERKVNQLHDRGTLKNFVFNEGWTARGMMKGGSCLKF